MKAFDIAVIGGGAAGCMAAIQAAAAGVSVALLERNESVGKKILITGKGRCNITNAAPIDVFIKKFAPGGEFLRSAFHALSNEDLMEFFASKGLELKVERQGRVFPVSDKAKSVVSVLEICLRDALVEIIFGARVAGIEGKDGMFALVLESGGRVEAKKVVIAAGGASYRVTGSSGDGFAIAERIGHRIVPLKGALVPLKTKETWVKDLQGLGLENVKIQFLIGGKKLTSDVGELMFTHFGVSGPLVLDMSGDVVASLAAQKEVPLTIDLKPGLRKEQLESKLIHKFTIKGGVLMKNLMHDVLPKRMIPVFLTVAKVPSDKLSNQITKEQRRSIIDTLKAFPLTITGCLSIEDAMVTGGGVSMKDIDPRTMESRVVPGLYFAGEVIEGAASSGGYNLQQAFSTGYLAGTKAAKAAMVK